MPRRCRGIRGDVGIAPYGGEQGVRSYNVSPSGASRHLSYASLRTTQCEHWAASQREAGDSAPAGAGCGFPRPVCGLGSE